MTRGLRSGDMGLELDEHAKRLTRRGEHGSLLDVAGELGSGFVDQRRARADEIVREQAAVVLRSPEHVHLDSVERGPAADRQRQRRAQRRQRVVVLGGGRLGAVGVVADDEDLRTLAPGDDPRDQQKARERAHTRS
jgi:hypothetical protein